MAPLWRRIVLPLAAGVFGLLIGLFIGGGADEPAPQPPLPTAPPVVPATPSTEAAAPSSPPSTPEPITAGPSEQTAVQAALDWAQRFTPALYLDPSGREAAFREVAAAEALDGLLAQAAQASDALTAAGLDVDRAAAAIRRDVPIGYRIDAYENEAATISVWFAGILHVDELVPLRTSWDTQTTRMVWQDDDWRLLSIDNTTGPVPDFTQAGDDQLPAVLSEITSFRELQHAP